MLKDLWGRAVKTLGLNRNQTGDASVAHLHREWDEHPSTGLTPARLATLMLEAEQGNLMAQCALAEDIEEKDAHVFSELQKRRRATLTTPFQVVPPDNASAAEKEDAALCQQWLESFTWLDDLRFDLSDAIFKAFSVAELQWQRDGNLWLPEGYIHQPATWFQVHPDNRNELRLRDNTPEGQELQPFGWVRHMARAKSGYLARAGLVRIIAWPYLFKNYSVRDLAEFLEIYGLPLRLGKYPGGASPQEKATLLRAVMSIGHNAGGIIPRGMDIEFQEAAKGTSDPYQAMINWAERSQSKAILGGTLTSGTGEGTNTNALGQVHNEVREELRDADLKQLAATLTRDLLFPIYALNCKSYNNPRRHPRLVFDVTEGEDLTQYAEALPKLVEIGLKIPTAWAHDKLQIPQPEGDEPVLALTPPSQPVMVGQAGAAMPDNGQTALTLRPAQPRTQGMAVLTSRPDDHEQALDNLLASLTSQQLNQQMKALLTPVLETLATDPAAAEAKLAELYPALDDRQIEETLARIMFVADIWGRLHANQ